MSNAGLVHAGKLGHPGRVVAFVRPADEPLARAQAANNLRPTGQQGNDAHAASFLFQTGGMSHAVQDNCSAFSARSKSAYSRPSRITISPTVTASGRPKHGPS